MSSKEKYEYGMELYKQGRTITSIAKELNISRPRFSSFLKENGFNPSNKKSVKSDIFEIIDTEEKAYWLGFMYADGYVSSDRNSLGICLQLIDTPHLEKFKDFLKYSGDVRVESNRCRVEFRDTKMKNDLIEKGCTPKKSLTLTFPNEDILPKELIRHFIRGYFDGDGCLCYTEKTLDVELIGTQSFTETVCDIIGIDKKRIYPLGRGSEAKRIVMGGIKDIEKFLTYIYEDCHIYLDRKYDKYLKLKIAVFNRDIKND